MRPFDLVLFRWVNGWPDAFNPLFYSLSEGNKWWPVRIALLAFLAYCLWKPKLRTPAVVALMAWPLANELCDVLKNVFQMPRPSVEVGDAIVRVARLTSYGTASAHSANMAAVATAFLYYSRGTGYFWLAVAILTGISRVYVGVHYPYQVLLGWAVGAAVAGSATAIWEAIKRKWAPRQGEPADDLPESGGV
ncbi:MAG: phosphatase PAP2 family protein [Armatimonadetes bacterium]|nr:phosphatase PAP2 family protein [Armatimonadota bacterium]MBX3110030.1 phosphatase PAP2 family protein [Fimbriimonadaceae bacterium]